MRERDKVTGRWISVPDPKPERPLGDPWSASLMAILVVASFLIGLIVGHGIPGA